jgi:hypothetical protein
MVACRSISWRVTSGFEAAAASINKCGRQIADREFNVAAVFLLSRSAGQTALGAAGSAIEAGAAAAPGTANPWLQGGFSVDPALEEQRQKELAQEAPKSPLYQMGQATKKLGKEQFPLTDEERKTWSADIGGVGGNIAGAVLAGAAGTALGGPLGGTIAAATTMGLQAAATHRK